jgi:hypothetical protein
MNIVSKKIHRLQQKGLFNRSNIIIFNGGTMMRNKQIVTLSYDNISPTTMICNNMNNSTRLSDLLKHCKSNLEPNIFNIVVVNCNKRFTADGYYDGCFENMDQALIMSHPYDHGIIGRIAPSPFLSEKYKKYAEGCKNVNLVLPQDEHRLIKWFNHVHKTSSKGRYQ